MYWRDTVAFIGHGSQQPLGVFEARAAPASFAATASAILEFPGRAHHDVVDFATGNGYSPTSSSVQWIEQVATTTSSLVDQGNALREIGGPLSSCRQIRAGLYFGRKSEIS
jgi:hypothetical protein